MKILFTGASSFTGYWFTKTLVAQGHEVCCTFTRGDATQYEGDVRGERVAQFVDSVRPVWSCCFGDDRFLESIADFRPDILCHHAANVTDYRSLDFDYQSALARNTYRIRDVLSALDGAGCCRLVLTGSVFEAGEGEGSDGLPSFSPYGLSKALTSTTFNYFCHERRFKLGTFVIPNPFGPWEEPRFTSYLARTWRDGKVAGVRTPLYVRDNIHVSLLAAEYQRFIAGLTEHPGFVKLNPSGYVETQQEFAERMAKEFRGRTGLTCELQFAEQTDFTEPLVRNNTQPVDGLALGWDESAAWDSFAEWYSS